MSSKITGECACAELRYELLREPIFVHCCHCTRCQRETGSAFALNALIESTQVKILQGQTQSIVVPTLSGAGQTIVRCQTCKTAVWSHYAAAREKISFVRVGTLNEPKACPVDIHIYTSSRMFDSVLPENVPNMPHYYKKADYWNEEGLARYAAAIKA